MAEELLLPGGSSEIEDFYIGPVRAFRVDTSNDELRLHDNSKVGGFRFINRDAMDIRYQARSIELDGFDFGPQLKGFLTRVSPATYRLRTFTVNTANLTLTNPKGLAGDPYWELAVTITSDHTVTGDWTFTEAIIASGGLTGNVIGNLTGNVLGNLTGNVTGNVTGNLTGNSTGNHTGGVDTRGAVLELDDGQIKLEWLEAAIHQLWIDRGLPLGSIIMWSGAADAIPESFLLCDGTEGTPDLRNRFIVGAGQTYAVAETGGSTSHSHSSSSSPSGAHEHTLTIAGHALTESEMPSHKHGNGVTDEHEDSEVFNHGVLAASPTTGDSIDNNGSTGDWEGYTTNTGGGVAHTHVGSTADNGGAHTHDLSTESTETLPPYFALCFIMKAE